MRCHNHHRVIPSLIEVGEPVLRCIGKEFLLLLFHLSHDRRTELAVHKTKLRRGISCACKPSVLRTDPLYTSTQLVMKYPAVFTVNVHSFASFPYNHSRRYDGRNIRHFIFIGPLLPLRNTLLRPINNIRKSLPH